MATLISLRDSCSLYEEIVRRSIQSQLDKVRLLERKVELQKESLRCDVCGLSEEEWNALPTLW